MFYPLPHVTLYRALLRWTAAQTELARLQLLDNPVLCGWCGRAGQRQPARMVTLGLLCCRRMVTTAAARPLRCSAGRPAALQTSFLRPACSLQSLCSSFGGGVAGSQQGLVFARWPCNRSRLISARTSLTKTGKHSSHAGRRGACCDRRHPSKLERSNGSVVRDLRWTTARRASDHVCAPLYRHALRHQPQPQPGGRATQPARRDYCCQGRQLHR